MLTQPPIEADASILFSVITTLSKNLDHLESWLESLLCQGHHQSTEILFVDVHSPHPERQFQIRYLLEKKSDEIAQSPYKFHFIECRQNVDLNTCLNQAIAAASGEWIYFLHSDDLVLKHTFFEFAAVIKECASVEVISGRFQSLNQHQDLTGKSPELAAEGFVSTQFKDLFLYKNPLTSGCTLYRKNVLQKCGGFNAVFGQAAEWDLLRRLAISGCHWYYVPRYLCAYRSGDRPDYWTGYLNGHMPDFWKVLESNSATYSMGEVQRSKLYNYQRLFQYVDLCFQDEQFAKGYQILIDLVQYSHLGDRLWLKTLEENHLKHKVQLIQIVKKLQLQSKR